MTNERAIEILERRTTIPDDDISWGEIMEALDLAIEALKMNMDVDFDKVREQFKSDGEIRQAPCNHETQKDDDLCKTCRYGDDCEYSCKIFSGCRTTRCYKYEGGRQ